MVNLVVLDHVVVAPEENRGVRGVVDQVVGGAAADAVQTERRPIREPAAAEVVDVVVVGCVPGGGERGTIAAGEADAALTGLIDVAADDGVIRASFNHNRSVAQVAQDAASDPDTRATLDVDSVAAADFKDQVLKRNV